jgi:tetratricopeptide (TPR) repeat protein
MNKMIVKYGIICFWMCRFLCTACLGNDNLSARQWLAEGDRLFEEGNFQQAGICFEKGFFESETPRIQALALIKKSDCYLAREAYSDASRVLSRMPYSEIGDTLAVIARQKSALAAYLGRDFSLAESHLMQALALIEDSSLTLHLMPFHALVFNEQQRWAEAKSVLLRYLERLSLPEDEKKKWKQSIGNQYETKKIPRLKNPEKAKMLSAFLPGLGYLYAGNISEGFWNVALQTLGLGLTGVGIFYGYYFTSAFVSISIFQKFYAGGINRSSFHARKWNYEKSRDFNLACKNLVIDLMKTKKAP